MRMTTGRKGAREIMMPRVTMASWLVLWLSSVLDFLGWLPPERFPSFLDHAGRDRATAAFPPGSRLQELDATWSSKGPSGKAE